MRILTIAIPALLLGACAQRGPTCDDAAVDSAVEEGLRAGSSAQALVRDMDRCDAGAVAERYRALACTPKGGWLLGLGSGVEPADCEELDRWWFEGYHLGQEYRRLTQRLAELEDDEAGPEHMRRIKLIRELDNVRGAAQLKDWPLPESDEAARP